MNISPKPSINTLPNEQVKTADSSITSAVKISSSDNPYVPSIDPIENQCIMPYNPRLDQQAIHLEYKKCSMQKS